MTPMQAKIDYKEKYEEAQKKIQILEQIIAQRIPSHNLIQYWVNTELKCDALQELLANTKKE